MKISQVRTFTKGYFPALLVTLTATAGAGAQAAINHHVHSVTVEAQHHSSDGNHSGDDRPWVSVNGHPVEVPQNGSTTLNQGGTQTTVEHHQDPTDPAKSGNTSATSQDDDRVSVSVTSGVSGQGSNLSHNRVYLHSDSGGTSTVHSHTTVSTKGAGEL